jgi:hypothetical protein
MRTLEGVEVKLHYSWLRYYRTWRWVFRSYPERFTRTAHFKGTQSQCGRWGGKKNPVFCSYTGWGSSALDDRSLCIHLAFLLVRVSPGLGGWIVVSFFQTWSNWRSNNSYSKHCRPNIDFQTYLLAYLISILDLHFMAPSLTFFF